MARAGSQAEPAAPHAQEQGSHLQSCPEEQTSTAQKGQLELLPVSRAEIRMIDPFFLHGLKQKSSISYLYFFLQFFYSYSFFKPASIRPAQFHQNYKIP